MLLVGKQLADMGQQTCYKYWLKLKDTICPCLDYLQDLAPKIEFIEPVAQAGQGVIMKVRIEDNIYALKLYTFMRPHWSPKRFEYYAATLDPFFVECRAYDALIDCGLNGKVGPHCYGWLTIDKDQERQVEKMHRGSISWNRREDTASDPVRGLLLEYIDGCTLDKATPPIDAQSLRDQMKLLNSASIIHSDMKASNVMVRSDGRGCLIDFGAALIWPNVRFPQERFVNWMRQELRIMEYYLFRLQNLERFQGYQLTTATTAEEAFGGEVSEYMSNTFPKERVKKTGLQTS